MLYYRGKMVEEGEVTLGIGGKPPQVGMFIRDFLRGKGESYPSEIHRAYKMAYRGWPTLSGRKYRLGTYNSFAVYMSKLVLCGLVERTGKYQQSNHPYAEALEYPERTYIKLTEKGRRAPDYVWIHPLRMWYRPWDWEIADYGNYIKPR